MRNTTLARLVLIVALLGTSWTTGTGCATHAVQTSRQLKGGELAVTGYGDIPGAIYFPRIGGEVMFGVGDVMDVSAHLGTSFLLNVTAGLGLRAYLGEWVTAGVQAMWTNSLLFAIDPANGGEFNIGFLNLTGRVHTTTTKERWFYGGLHVAGTSVLEDRDGGTGRQLRYAGLNAGAMLGAEFPLSDAFRAQLELTLAPVMIGPKWGVAVFPNYDSSDEDFVPFVGQLSVAFHWNPAGGDASRRAKPSEERRRPNLNAREEMDRKLSNTREQPPARRPAPRKADEPVPDGPVPDSPAPNKPAPPAPPLPTP